MEQWKPIPGWLGFYEVSDRGRVRSLTRDLRMKNPHGELGTRRFKGRVLAAAIAKNGYLMVSLTAPKKKRCYAYVHALVLRAFVGRPPKGHEVRHLDGTRRTNTLGNLCYGTRSQNSRDRILHGTIPDYRGEKAAFAKLTNEDVTFIRQHASSLSMRALGRKFGVAHGTIAAVIYRRSWGHIA